MHGVEGSRFGWSQPHQPDCSGNKARALQMGNDLTGFAAANGVRLDDAESQSRCHASSFMDFSSAFEPLPQ
jgi:hypothetical protein